MSLIDCSLESLRRPISRYIHPFRYIYPVLFSHLLRPSMSIYLYSVHTHTHVYKCTHVCACVNTYTCTPRQIGDLFERSPWSQLGSNITRDRPIRGVSIRQTHTKEFPSVLLPRSETPSCQQCTPIWTHTYIHTIHACTYTSWLDVLVYGGGNRRQRERQLEIGSGDDWLVTMYICTLYYPPRFHPDCCLRSQSPDYHSGGHPSPLPQRTASIRAH